MFCLNTVYVYLLYYILFVDSSLPFLKILLFGVNIHHPLLSCCVVKFSQIFQPCKKKNRGFSNKNPSQNQKKSPHQKSSSHRRLTKTNPPNQPELVLQRSPFRPSKGREIGCLCGAMSEEVAESQGHRNPLGRKPMVKKNDLGAQFCLVGFFYRVYI